MTEKKNQNEEPQYYLTRDITEAATLVTLKFYVERVDSQIEGRRIEPVSYFNFKDTEELRKTLNLYRRKELAVEPQEFMMSLRSLKAYTTNQAKAPRGYDEERN